MFNGYRDLASHLKALEKAMDEAEQHLIQAIVYREPNHPMSWEEGQILIATIDAIEGSFTSCRRTPLTTSTIHGAVDKLDTEQWQSLEQDVRQFIEQQHHVFVELKSTVEAFRSEFDSLSRGHEPRPNLWSWAGSEVQLVELFYALTQVGALVWTGEKLPNEEMAGEFAHLFRTEVRQVDSTISRAVAYEIGHCTCTTRKLSYTLQGKYSCKDWLLQEIPITDYFMQGRWKSQLRTKGGCE